MTATKASCSTSTTNDIYFLIITTNDIYTHKRKKFREKKKKEFSCKEHKKWSMQKLISQNL